VPTVATVPIVTIAPPPAALGLVVDASDAPQQILHATLSVPAAPGPLTLVYPKWLPGDHGPSGPVTDLVGLRLEAAGRAIPWERDSTDWFAFRCDVPAGASRITATYDFVWPASPDGNSDDGVSPQLAMLTWSSIVLYPKGSRMGEISISPEVRPPDGWTVASALEIRRSTGGAIVFETVTLERLIDSPVLMGAHVNRLQLAPGTFPAHEIVLAADSREALHVAPELELGWHRLVDETLALVRTPHYRHYAFLVPLSDQISQYGLEHHESSENRVPERMLLDDAPRLANATLLAHELFHSWNGKYRRPADMVRDDFQAPLTTELLWVYEGLTEYYGWVLATRAGLLEPDEAKDEIARVAAQQLARPGRAWRSLRDVSVSAYLTFTAPAEWTGLRRGTDFYGEGQLLWLEVDARIRERTKDRRSLDDFARAFFGGGEKGRPEVVPYRLEDVIAGLEAVAPGDWAAFFRERVDRAPGPDVRAGLRTAGFELAFRDSLTPYLESYEAFAEALDLRHSLGLRIDDEGSVRDVLPGTPAYEAGLGPGMTITAVNGRKWRDGLLRDALREARTSQASQASGTAASPRPGADGSIELLVESGEFFRVVEIDGRTGDRQPFLERRKGTRDRLKDILAPRAKARNVNSLKRLPGRSAP
jgi:predicted metalloprotease with PDZ domain